MKNSTFASFGNSIILPQFFNGGKMVKWKVGAVEKCPRWRSLWVEIVPFSVLYYKMHTISILQVRKLVVQVTSTSTSRKTCTTSYKYKYKYKLQELKNRPLAVGFFLSVCVFLCCVFLYFWQRLISKKFLPKICITFSNLKS